MNQMMVKDQTMLNNKVKCVAQARFDIFENILERCSSEKSRFLFNLVVDTKNDDPKYWCNWSKKEAHLLLYVLTNIDNEEPLNLLKWYLSRSTMIGTDIEDILRYLSYKKNYSDYLVWFFSEMEYFSLDKKILKKRFDCMHKELEENIKIQYIKEKLGWM